MPSAAPPRPRCRRKQARRNVLSRQVGEGRRRGEDTAALESEATSLRSDMEALEQTAAALDGEIRSARSESLPNVLDADVPDGADETANVVLKQWGEPQDLGFQPKQHFELGEALRMMDFETAAKLAGSRFTILRGPLARLERALGQFMIDLHYAEHGYEEIARGAAAGQRRSGLRHRQACRRNSPRICSAPPMAAG